MSFETNSANARISRNFSSSEQEDVQVYLSNYETSDDQDQDNCDDDDGAFDYEDIFDSDDESCFTILDENESDGEQVEDSDRIFDDNLLADLQSGLESGNVTTNLVP